MEQTRKGLVIGVVAGLFSGLTGVGGGPLLVGLLVSVLGLSQHLAQGTTPAVILPIALFGAITYALQGSAGQFSFDLRLAAEVVPALALPSMAGVLIGSTWMAQLPAGQLRRAFGVFLFIVAFSMLTREVLHIGTPPGAPVAIPVIFWILLGFVVGVTAGFLGVGGAILLVPFMSLGAGMEQHMSQGVTLAIVTITTVVGAVAQYRLGNVHLPTVRTIAPASVIAVVAGSLIAGQLEAVWLARLFGVAMIYFGYQFTFGRRPAPRPEAARLDPSAGYYSI